MIRSVFNNLMFIRYLIAIFPILLVTGPFIPELVIFLSIFFFKNYYIFFKQNTLFKSIILFCLIVWLVLLVGSINSNYILISLEKSLFFIRFFLFIFFLIFLFNLYDDLILVIYNVLQALIFLLIFDSLFQYIFGFNLLGMKYEVRLSSFFGDELILGSYLSKIYALFIVLNFYQNNNDNLFINKKKLFKHVLIFSLVYLIILLTGERAAFIFINLFIIIFLFLKKNTRFIGYCFIIVAITSCSLLFNLNEGLKARFVDNFKIQSKIDIKNNKFFPRDYAGFFQTSLEIYESNKIIGSGVRTFRYECNKYQDIISNSCNNHPHNYFFEILSETGSIGILLFIIFILYFFKNFIKYSISCKNQNYLAYINLYIILLFQPIMTTGSFFNNWNLCLNSFLISIAVYSNCKKGIHKFTLN